jgi:MinD-like ATPase involved in chromosome partitioning or flagellar assembly
VQPPRVLLAAGGAGWESLLLPLLTAPGSPAALARRCVDVPDLVAAAAAGQGTVAAVASDLAGLDADAVDRLVDAGVAVLAVAATASSAHRLHELGVDTVLDAGEVAADPSVLLALAAEIGAGARRQPVDIGPPAPRPTTGDTSPDRGRLVAVWGATGAPGRSTVALGLAAAAAAAGTETVLVDADVYGGATAQMLAVLDEVSGVLAAARAASTGSLDRAGLEQAVRQVAPRLRVLTGLPRADRWTALRPAALRGVLARARQVADLVVVDCGFCLEQDEELSYDTAAPRRNGATVTALEEADLLVVVGSADPHGLARLARARHDLREAVPTARVRLVVNRVRGGLGWSRDDVSRTLLQTIGEVPLAYLPLDQAAVDTCWVRGQTLLEGAPQSGLTRALGELAAAVIREVGIGARPAAVAARRRARLRR